MSRCPEACLHGGRCINGECQCKEGWTGPHCGQPICGLRSDDMVGCRNGGRCIGPDKCACVYGFTGNNCEKDYRAGPCFTKMEDDQCFGQLEEVYCTKALCCNTIGRAWGSPCEECPVRAEPCGRGFMPPSCADINECEAIVDVCKNCECKNTHGSYKCIAPDGFYYDQDKNECFDVDECKDSPCGDGECINTDGGYQCVCADGHENVTGPDGKQTCVYNGPGICYEHVSNAECTDALDEEITRSDCCCIRGTRPTGQCFQTSTSNVVAVCPIPGSDEYVKLCDISDMPRNITNPDHICKLKGQCMNGKCVLDAQGQLNCLCDDGYESDPIDLVCQDVNECEVNPNLCPHGSCRNSDGSWYCDCNAGYEPADDRQSCVQVNECLEGDKCANGQCVDTDGSWRCDCDDGFRPDVRQKNQVCIDVDECSLR